MQLPAQDKRYKSSIPKEAIEKVRSRYPDGSVEYTDYFEKGEKVGSRHWEQEGTLGWEGPFKGGVKHGREYDWVAGILLSVEPFVDGKPHGLCKQWDDAGNLMQTYRMVHGTGLDLWRCNITGTLAEVCYWKDNVPCGWVWLLDEDQKSVWCERHHHEGTLHGIWREWNAQGRISRGYPQYYIRSEKVTKRKYVKACESDPTLPPFRQEDNLPQRTFPPEVAEHLGVPKNFYSRWGQDNDSEKE